MALFIQIELGSGTAGRRRLTPCCSSSATCMAISSTSTRCYRLSGIEARMPASAAWPARARGICLATMSIEVRAAFAPCRRVTGPGHCGRPGSHALCGNHRPLSDRVPVGRAARPRGSGGLVRQRWPHDLGRAGYRRGRAGRSRSGQLAARARAAAGPETLAVLRRLELSREIGGYVCVHAGISPTRPLGEHGRNEFLWLREPFSVGAGGRPSPRCTVIPFVVRRSCLIASRSTAASTERVSCRRYSSAATGCGSCASPASPS